MSKILQGKLITILEEKGPLRRKELVKELNKPRSTIYDNLEHLLMEDKIERFTRKLTDKPGAPFTFWRIKDKEASDKNV